MPLRSAEQEHGMNEQELTRRVLDLKARIEQIEARLGQDNARQDNTSAATLGTQERRKAPAPPLASQLRALRDEARQLPRHAEHDRPVAVPPPLPVALIAEPLPA